MTSRKEILLIACKIFGVYFFVQSVWIIQSMVGDLMFQNDYDGRGALLLYHLVTLGLSAIAGILLIRKAPSIAGSY